MSLEPITPGEILKNEFMQPFELTAAELSRMIMVPSGRLSQILNNKREISADTALILSKFFGNSAQFWLNLQSRYNLKIARQIVDKDEFEAIKQIKFA